MSSPDRPSDSKPGGFLSRLRGRRKGREKTPSESLEETLKLPDNIRRELKRLSEPPSGPPNKTPEPPRRLLKRIADMPTSDVPPLSLRARLKETKSSKPEGSGMSLSERLMRVRRVDTKLQEPGKTRPTWDNKARADVA
ncbi:MAG: hypothetical protein WAX57_01885, partial [Minisyncoccia bacterium]